MHSTSAGNVNAYTLHCTAGSPYQHPTLNLLFNRAFTVHSPCGHATIAPDSAKITETKRIKCDNYHNDDETWMRLCTPCIHMFLWPFSCPVRPNVLVATNPYGNFDQSDTTHLWGITLDLYIWIVTCMLKKPCQHNLITISTLRALMNKLDQWSQIYITTETHM
jgi:hypothetical protein